MELHTKNIFLQNCNTLSSEQLVEVVNTGSISIEELKEAGLSEEKLNSLLTLILAANKVIENKSEKDVFLNKIENRKVKADEIKLKINNKIISFDDLENLSSLSQKTINSLKYYTSSNRMTTFRTIDKLPAMEEGRTDLYFIGVPGSGKSTMLSGILHSAHKNGILLPDPYNQDGSIFQNQLISDLNKGVLPQATAHGSYNYIALSIEGEDKKRHPFNIVEVPGENYVQMYNNGDVEQFLSYIQNSNKKILVFVIDSLAHHTGYLESTDQNDQSLVYPNILQLFHANGILEQTDAIYLVSNKFDAIYESLYAGDERPHEEIASEFLHEEFLNLINNCKAVRDESKNKFKIKLLPFSIGKVSYETILESYNQTYATNILNEIISDSFIVKGGRWSKIFNK
jgi:hypothetical protein